MNQQLVETCRRELSSGVEGAARAQWEEFQKWREPNRLEKLLLCEYTNLLGLPDAPQYFTHVIERRTHKCGRFAPSGGSSAYGIYRTRAGTAGKVTYRFNGELLDEQEAIKKFEVVRSALVEVSKLNLEAETDFFDVNFARKVAYMFNPGALLPIYKTAVIDRIADAFGIEIDCSSYLATQTIMQELGKALGLASPTFEDTQKLGGFLFSRFSGGFDLTHKNVIFYGAPGTGKTYRVTEGVNRLVEDVSDEDLKAFGLSRSHLVDVAQFHASYTYEDFIEGLRPVTQEKGGIDLVLQSGRFKEFCKRAMDNLRSAKAKQREPLKFFFIADEINRAELSRVLGEVLVCLEPSRRIHYAQDGNLRGTWVKTQYAHLSTAKDAVLADQEGEDLFGGQSFFGIPENLYFFGTMNDVDRSIDSFDMALRRRFVWKRMDCDYEVLDSELGELTGYDAFRECCVELNRAIREDLELGSSFEIGHAYFLEIGQGRKQRLSKASMGELFDLRIRPLLAEYLRAKYDERAIERKLKELAEAFAPEVPKRAKAPKDARSSR